MREQEKIGKPYDGYTENKNEMSGKFKLEPRAVGQNLAVPRKKATKRKHSDKDTESKS